MKVKIYTLSTCPHCKAAKKFLKEHDIKFENIEVDDNEKAIEEMYKKSKQYGVPVVEIRKSHGVYVIAGFDKEKLKELLNIDD